ncbi:hypothetical protein Gotur_035640, partial [Gossypium turneri]
MDGNSLESPRQIQCLEPNSQNVKICRKSHDNPR